MELKLKSISHSGIPEALDKAWLYRYLNEPEEAESICHDVLAIEPEHQAALRTLGLAITDQFYGNASDRYTEAEGIFQRLTDPYERHYFTGLLYERRAKAHLHAGTLLRSIVVLFETAMHEFEQAEKLRPPQNDDAILRWNRCVRLLQSLPTMPAAEEEPTFHDDDLPPPARRTMAR